MAGEMAQEMACLPSTSMSIGVQVPETMKTPQRHGRQPSQNLVLGKQRKRDLTGFLG